MTCTARVRPSSARVPPFLTSSTVLSSLEALGVDTVLGERLDLASAHKPLVRTESGREILADLVVRLVTLVLPAKCEDSPQLLCTGQKPNTSMVASVLPNAIDESGFIRVARSMQIAVPDDNELEEDAVRVPHAHMFAIGDAADAFGAMKAGHCAYYQVSAPLQFP